MPISPLQNMLGQLHGDLAEARDESALVAAVVRCVSRYQPHEVRLFYIHYDEERTPFEAELVARWRHKDGMRPTAATQRFRVADFALAALGMSHPDQVCVVPDIAADWRVQEQEKQRCAAAGDAAIVILPCYTHSAQTWQGVLSILWPAIHTPDAEELYVYNLIARMLSAFIANRRMLLAHQETQRELTLINEVSLQLSAAQTIEQALRAVATPFMERGAASALWSVLHLKTDGSPVDVEIVAYWHPRPTSLPSLVGQRFPVSSAPLAALWISDPDNPLLLGDVHTDPRLDDAARKLLVTRGRAAMMIWPLRTRGRWVGTIIFAWDEPQNFTRRDHEMCKSLASQAAIVFDNRTLMERMQETVREQQRQSLALKALLDYMPVGVLVVDAASGVAKIVNPKAQQILGSGVAAVSKREDFAAAYKLYAEGNPQPLALTELPLGQTMADGQLHQREVEMVRPDGTRVSLELFSGPILDEQGVMHSAMTLFLDISERRRAEFAQVRMHKELIDFQAAALAERSTPLIPISDEILVLPLIGSLDTERGQQVLDTLLHGVSQSGTRVAIIDVTGVRTLDTQAAQTLTQAAQALRLLGVEPVLTGIRAEVAQTLVSLGVPLGGIATRSTLQSGIAYANRKKLR